MFANALLTLIISTSGEPMKEVLPKPLNEALAKGVEYFAGEQCEWKLEEEKDTKQIEKAAGCLVCVFANNGLGDYLFLKKNPDGDGYEERAFEYFHEGPEINPIADDLETLLELKDRPPSSDTYPKAIYESGELVQLGDRVQIKVWAQFWKGWQDGKVTYVPGVSNKNLRHEYGGLKWIVIEFESGEICPVVDPNHGRLRKVRFIGRTVSVQQPSESDQC